MNCELYREKIARVLAAGENLQAGEVSVHLRACFACREFYETQAGLFRSIDAGLQSLVAQPVPSSLIPGVRDRLQNEPDRHRLWVPAWTFGVLATAAVMVVSLNFFGHHPQSSLQSAGMESQVSDVSEYSGLAPHVRTETPRIHRPSRRGHASTPAPQALTSQQDEEVIVLPEERQAFATFIAEIPEKREVAVALTRPATAAPDVPAEIALLQIASLEVKPLEGTPRE